MSRRHISSIRTSTLLQAVMSLQLPRLHQYIAESFCRVKYQQLMGIFAIFEVIESKISNSMLHPSKAFLTE